MPRPQKLDQEILNPCLKEQNMTYKCLDDNNYDRDACLNHMANYKNCKKFWSFVQSQRRRKGQYPLLPPVEEREQAKKEYIADFKP